MFLKFFKYRLPGVSKYWKKKNNDKHETLAYQTKMCNKGKEIRPRKQKGKSKWWKEETWEVQYRTAVEMEAGIHEVWGRKLWRDPQLARKRKASQDE